MIKPDRIGHVVIKVRSLERALEFYTQVLGLDVMNDLDDQPPGVKAAFLANNRRDHHELALLEVGADATEPPSPSVGMAHFAFRLGSRDELEPAYKELVANGVTINFTVRHGVTDSIYFFDPDGNELEVYVDNPRELVESLPSPYFGLDKLGFAPDAPSIMEALQRS